MATEKQEGRSISVYLFSVYNDFSGNYSSLSDQKESAYRVAAHEAGHFFVNQYEFPGTTEELRIFNSQDYNNVNYYLGRKNVDFIPGGLHRARRTTIYKEQLLKSIKVSLAGMISERIITSRQEAGLGSNSDINTVKNIVVELIDNGLVSPYDSGYPIKWELLTMEEQKQIYQKIVEPLYMETEDLVKENRDKIKSLADELVKKRKMTGSEAIKILK